jgi:tripartite-type tricarboxylate transporter receptor subunit TctC
MTALATLHRLVTRGRCRQDHATEIGKWGEVSMWLHLRSRIAVLSAVALLSCLTAAGAQTWPARAITLVAAFPPNTTTDYAARTVAQELTKALGHPVIVETKAGGGGVLASVSVAKAPADGYTLLMTTIGPAVLRPLLEPGLAYDPVADFTPVALVGDAPNVIVAGTQSRFQSISDIVAYAKQSPGKLTIGHPGIGTMGHLVALLFCAEADIDANLISYQGAPAILTDVAGGHIDIGAVAYGVGANAVKTLAVTTKERVDFLPDVPTMGEVNYPNVVATTWSAVYAPAHLPPDIVGRLNATINTFIRQEDTRKHFTTVGYRVLGGPPQRLADQMAEDHAKWSKVIAAAKLGGK